MRSMMLSNRVIRMTTGIQKVFIKANLGLLVLRLFVESWYPPFGSCH
jgi:hypothetical protein